LLHLLVALRPSVLACLRRRSLTGVAFVGGAAPPTPPGSEGRAAGPMQRGGEEWGRWTWRCFAVGVCCFCLSRFGLRPRLSAQKQPYGSRPLRHPTAPDVAAFAWTRSGLCPRSLAQRQSKTAGTPPHTGALRPSVLRVCESEALPLVFRPVGPR
jgi:hypothetical protein